MGRAKDKVTGLTELEESLCQAMLTTTNQTEAYRRSMYSSDNMQMDTIQRASSVVLRKPHVIKRLRELRNIVSDAACYDAADLLKDMLEVMKIAKRMAVNEGDSKNTSAFKGLADSIGKHINIQAFNEKSEVLSNVNLNAKYSILGVEPDSD